MAARSNGADSRAVARQVAVTAGPGSAGALINYKHPTSKVELVNSHQFVAVEFQINSGSWQRLDGNCSIALDIDMASDALRVRRSALEGGAVSVNLNMTVDLTVATPVQGNVRWAIAGDSITEPWNYSVGNGATIVAPGVARATFPAAFGNGVFWPGDAIKVTGAPTRDCNQQHAIVSAIDPARMWIEYGVSPERENAVLSGTPTIYRKYSGATASFLLQACAQLGIPFECSVDAAIGGGDSEQVNELLRRDYVSSDVALYAPGMNDVYSRQWGFERIKAADIANLKILRQAPVLIILGIFPRAPTNNAWSAARFAIWRKVNEWRREYAAAIGAIFIEPTAANLRGRTYSDPLTATSAPYLNGPTQTMTDGVHPYGLGGGVLGGAVANPLLDYQMSDLLPASIAVAVEDGYVVPNPLMQRGVAGAVAGVANGVATFQNLAGAAGAEVADNFRLNVDVGGVAGLVIKAGVVPRTVAVHGDGAGYAQRIIIDNTANAANAWVSLRTTSFHAQMVDGDALAYGMHLLTSDAATPGSGDPAGLTSLSVVFNDQHLTSLNKMAAALAGDNGTGRWPGLKTAPIAVDQTRRVASAGAFSDSTISTTIIVAAGSTACVDVGRVLGRRLAAQ